MLSDVKPHFLVVLEHCHKAENLRIVTHAPKSPPGICAVIQVFMGVEVLYESPSPRAPQAVSCANGRHCTVSCTVQTFNLKPFSVNVRPSELGNCNTNCSHLICELLRVMMIKELYTTRGDETDAKGRVTAVNAVFMCVYSRGGGGLLLSRATYG